MRLKSKESGKQTTHFSIILFSCFLHPKWQILISPLYSHTWESSSLHLLYCKDLAWALVGAFDHLKYLSQDESSLWHWVNAQQIIVFEVICFAIIKAVCLIATPQCISCLTYFITGIKSRHMQESSQDKVPQSAG